MSNNTRRSVPLDLSGLGDFADMMNAGGDVVASAGKPLNLDLARIEEDPRNARKKYDPAKMEELAETIRANGLTTPIVVKVHPDDPKRYRIVHGHRRFRVHRDMLGVATIEAILTDKQDSASQLVDNLQREDLTLAETVSAIAGLLGDGLKQTEIASRLGKSKTWVSRYAALTDLPPELQELLDNERCRDASTLYEALQCYKQDADAVRAFLATTGDRQIVQTDVENLRAAMKRGAQTFPATSEPETPATETTTAAPSATDGAGDDGSKTPAAPLAAVLDANGEGGAGAEDEGGKASAQALGDGTRQEGQDGSTIPVGISGKGEGDGDDGDGDGQRRQNVKPAAAAADPMKVRKPLVQVRVGRREGVMLIAKKAEYGLAWVQFENGDEEQMDVNKIKLVAVTDAAK